MPHNHEGVDYFTSDDVARTFDVKQNTVTQWVKRGFIAPDARVKQGRNVISLFTRETVQAFAQKKYGSN